MFLSLAIKGFVYSHWGYWEEGGALVRGLRSLRVGYQKASTDHFFFLFLTLGHEENDPPPPNAPTRMDCLTIKS